jgi:hypothetical protein
MPIIGYLNIGGQPGSGGQPNATSLAGFRAGLNEPGYVEGRTVAIEIRATDKYEQLPALASDLVRLKPAVIVVAPTVNSEGRDFRFWQDSAAGESGHAACRMSPQLLTHLGSRPFDEPLLYGNFSP